VFFRELEHLAVKLHSEGYWLAFSGGKDSIVIKDLATRAGVKFRPVYNVTTIDPPELTRFIKREHPDVVWNMPPVPFFRCLAEKSNGPPTRIARWCCAKFKERGGRGWARVIGVRAAESTRRRANWKMILADRKSKGVYLCPILYWTDADVWEYIHGRNLSYCELYDQGFKRLGCVGCPLAGQKTQAAEFRRWPGLKRAWKRLFLSSGIAGMVFRRTWVPLGGLRILGLPMACGNGGFPASDRTAVAATAMTVRCR